jgi:hypothetical protein
VGREIVTEVEIDAPVEVVWGILSDTAAYAEWNPFLVRVDGEPQAGARISVRFSPPGGRAMTMKPRVLVVDPPRELRWKGSLGVPGIFDGEHIFQLEALDATRTRVVQREEFGGFLVPLTGKLLRRTEAGFQAMNEALRARAEARV